MDHRLLLADDSITIQKVVELILSDEGFLIHTAGNGEEAWLAIPEFKPDIVLADIEMPVMNGYRLCEKIKTDPLTKDLPVILMAGAFEPLEEDTLKRVGADDYIIKPFESLELIDKLTAVFTAREAVKSTPEGIATSEEVSETAAAGESFEAETLVSEDSATEDQEVPLIDSIEETFPELTIPEEDLKEEESGDPQVTTHLLPQFDFPSRDEITDIIKNSIDNQVSSVFLLSDSRDSMDRILRETIPLLAEKYIEEILRANLSSVTRRIEEVILEAVPRIAETVISKEIERIKSEL